VQYVYQLYQLNFGGKVNLANQWNQWNAFKLPNLNAAYFVTLFLAIVADVFVDASKHTFN